MARCSENWSPILRMCQKYIISIFIVPSLHSIQAHYFSRGRHLKFKLSTSQKEQKIQIIFSVIFKI